MPVETRYRLAREGDVPGISSVFTAAYNDLYSKRGMLDAPLNPNPPNPVFAFLIRKTPDAFWVAEEDGRIIAYSDSFVRGTFWYFSWLFVSPGSQGKDIGRNLLEKTLGSWKGVRITNRATMTFANNPVSQSLYMRYGMYPREPAYFVEGRGETLRDDPKMPGLRFEELSSLREATPVVKKLDRAVLGFPLDWHHEFFFETKSKCFVFSSRGEQVGYAYFRPSGSVGPVAVSSSRFSGPVFEAALKLAAAQGVEKVRFFMPGSNVGAVELVLRHRMRIDPFVHMSTKPLARWGNYIFHSAALM